MRDEDTDAAGWLFGSSVGWFALVRFQKEKKTKGTSGIRHTNSPSQLPTPNPAVRARLRQLKIHLPFPWITQSRLGRITAGAQSVPPRRRRPLGRPPTPDRPIPAASRCRYRPRTRPSKSSITRDQASSRPRPLRPTEPPSPTCHTLCPQQNPPSPPNETQHMAPRGPSSRVCPCPTPVCPRCCDAVLPAGP